VADAANKNLVAAVFILVFVVAMVSIYIANRNKSASSTGNSTTTTAGGESLVGNVGGGGIYNIDAERDTKGSKPQLCYTDMDCPDETTCGSAGMCIPMMHTLPQSRHLLKLGLGRDGEKAV
jgi:hypothetical protein